MPSISDSAARQAILNIAPLRPLMRGSNCVPIR
jgi:hypothetical protein